MAEIRYKIAKYPIDSKDDHFRLYISSKTADQLNLKYGNNIILECGSKRVSVLVTVIISVVSQIKLEDGVLWITSNTFEELSIPELIEVRIQMLKNNTLMKIGPVIGILTEGSILEAYKKGRPTREAFEYYSSAGNKVGALIYVFALNDIDLNNNRIKGYVPLVNESRITNWQEQWVPIPDAIHNRIKISPSNSGYTKIDAMLKLQPNIKIINKVTKIYKWRIQKILEKNREAKIYLPKTLLFRGINTLALMLEKFPFIYLKPVGRSLGLGIIKIIREETDQYTAKYRNEKSTYSISGSLTYILAKLKPLMGKRSYIVQEGIPLAAYNGNIFDLRVSVQKDETGTWSVSRWKVRVAAPNSIVTNISAGGSGARIEHVLGSVFKDKASQVMNEIKAASLIICRALDNSLLDLGDIGLDIGVTGDGRIYFIEANFRELRLNGGSAEDSENWANTFKKPIYYLNSLYNNQLQEDLL